MREIIHARTRTRACALAHHIQTNLLLLDLLHLALHLVHPLLELATHLREFSFAWFSLHLVFLYHEDMDIDKIYRTWSLLSPAPPPTHKTHTETCFKRASWTPP
jgi:hypothetical protein